MLSFREDEGDVRSNYVALARSTGESFDSIADRIAESGDPATAAKIRSLADDYPEIEKEQRRQRAAARERAEAQAENEPPADRHGSEQLQANLDAAVGQVEDLKREVAEKDLQLLKLQGKHDELEGRLADALAAVPDGSSPEDATVEGATGTGAAPDGTAGTPTPEPGTKTGSRRSGKAGSQA